MEISLLNHRRSSIHFHVNIFTRIGLHTNVLTFEFAWNYTWITWLSVVYHDINSFVKEEKDIFHRILIVSPLYQEFKSLKPDVQAHIKVIKF